MNARGSNELQGVVRVHVRDDRLSVPVSAARALTTELRGGPRQALETLETQAQKGCA
jgi:hypothetical protein